LDRAREDIRGAGGDVLAVFQYRAEPTRNFCRQRRVGIDCLGDPERAAYEAVGLERGSLKEYLGPQLLSKFVRAARQGAFLGKPAGDVAQRPGTFVIGTDGRVLLAHYNADSADNPPMDRVLDAVRAGAAS
jgi:peroxiredoxin